MHPNPPSSRGQALTFPPEGGGESGEGEGRFENRLYGAQEGRVRGGKMGSRIRLHEGRLFVRTTEGDAVCDKISS